VGRLSDGRPHGLGALGGRLPIEIYALEATLVEQLGQANADLKRRVSRGKTCPEPRAIAQLGPINQVIDLVGTIGTIVLSVFK
jgi:hypothetical protein